MRLAGSVGSRVGALLFAVATLVATFGLAEAGEALAIYRVDPELTSAQFAVSHLGLSMQRGHFGRTRGTIALDPDAHTGQIEFIVDAASIDTGWAARDAFLRGEDMFDTAHYPVVRFRSTRLAFDSARLVDVFGELPMHNVTRPSNCTSRGSIAARIPKAAATAAAPRSTQRSGAPISA
jgi:polyisoprenoid-binding protein YceI